MNIDLSKFHTSVREERLFCGILFHLLLQRGSNLQLFVDAVNEQLPPDRQLGTADPESAIYIEFTYLRDSWYALGRDNGAKWNSVFDLFSRSPILARLDRASFPSSDECGEFNERFMGVRGARIRADVAYPGQWPVKALYESFGSDVDVFRELCRLKWSFNIKPDLVVVAADAPPIFVEAKLESREGSYPTSNEECAIFDAAFGAGKGRVGQVELQQFMFGTLLGTPGQPVVVGRQRFIGDNSVPFVSWANLFSRLDLVPSIPFVRRVATENQVLDRARIPDAEVPPDEA